MDWLTRWLEQPSKEERTLLVLGEPATGKSTLLKRVGYDIASLGHVVLYVQTLNRIDVDTAARCLNHRTSPSIILVDNLADCAEQILDLLGKVKPNMNVAIVGVERGYRKEHVDIVMSDVRTTVNELGVPKRSELDQLLEKYQQSGLIANPRMLKNRQHAINALRGDPMAISVCRILNDFRPLDRVIVSLWDDADARQRKIYLTCALARRCHAAGVRQSVMQLIAGTGFSVNQMSKAECSLPLSSHPSDDDFLLPRNAVVAERVLTRISKQDPDLMMDVFTGLAKCIAPRVNRKAIRRRTPEARLAGRLFDADKIVKPLLATRSENFYIAAWAAWKWNSRYWEQRALLIVERDIRTALQFARHAVAIEDHPFPLTTLGKVLLSSMGSCVGDVDRADVFAEAFSVLGRAISMEANTARVTVRPFSTLLIGTAKFLESGGSLTLEQHDTIRNYAGGARTHYGDDVGVAAAIKRLDSLM